MMVEFRDTGYFVKENGDIVGKKKILKPTLLSDGYSSVCLYYNGKSKTYLIHRMVAECYLPNIEQKPQVNHKDGDKLNNHVDNLEWSTAKENVNHFINNISTRKIDEQPNSKLTLKQMFDIYRCHTNDGIYQIDLAKKYGVCRTTISRAICNVKKELNIN